MQSTKPVGGRPLNTGRPLSTVSVARPAVPKGDDVIPPGLLTRDQFAKFLAIPLTTLDSLVQVVRPKMFKVGRKWMIYRTDAEEYALTLKLRGGVSVAELDEVRAATNYEHVKEAA